MSLKSKISDLIYGPLGKTFGPQVRHVRRSPGPKSLGPDDVVIFLNNEFNSFNLVNLSLLKACHRSFERNTFWDALDNFNNYSDAACATVTWTHFWDAYRNLPSRKKSAKDFRFFAVNYCRLSSDSHDSLDYWTQQILSESFIALPISNFCRDFLNQHNVPHNRTKLLSLGYPETFRFNDRVITPANSSAVTIGHITNSNDIHRYGTDIFLKSLQDLLHTNPELIKSLEIRIKDYGRSVEVVKNLVQKHLAESLVPKIESRYLSEEELQKWYETNELLVAPFRGEGFGMKLLEAQICESTVIAPNFGGPKDFLNKGSFIECTYQLTPLSKGIDKTALSLDSSYLEAESLPSSVAGGIKSYINNRRYYQNLARHRAAQLRLEFSWQSSARQLMNYVRE
jgi:glycosyltransferase involved in cell wall biosynthesis